MIRLQCKNSDSTFTIVQQEFRRLAVPGNGTVLLECGTELMLSIVSESRRVYKFSEEDLIFLKVFYRRICQLQPIMGFFYSRYAKKVRFVKQDVSLFGPLINNFE